MFSLFNRKKKGQLIDKVPEWANYFSLQEANLFLEKIRNNFPNEEVVINFDDGLLLLPISYEKAQFGLSNLAVKCHNSDSSEWEKIIKDYFTSFAEQKIFMEEFDKISGDISKVSKYLAVKIWPGNYADILNHKDHLFKVDIEDTISALVFDFPTTVTNVAINYAEKWNKNFDELFEIGLNNVYSNYEFEVSTHSVNDGKLHVLGGEHFFVPSIALLINKYDMFLGEYGSIIGIPNRHEMIVYPINGVDVIPSITQLINLIYSHYSELDGAISPNIYWFKDSRYMKLPYEIGNENEIEFYPPEEFVALLNEIVGE